MPPLPCAGVGLPASVHHPPTSPITNVLTSVNSAKGNPKNPAATVTESTPVCGVLIINATVAPSLAPCRFRLSPTGITAQEHSGIGTPMAAAFTTPHRPRKMPPQKVARQTQLEHAAGNAPTNSHGASSSRICQIATIMRYHTPPNASRPGTSPEVRRGSDGYDTDDSLGGLEGL